MYYVLEEPAYEGSSYFPSISAFLDEDGDTFTPDTLKWNLIDMQGNIIRAEQTVAVPGTSLNICLTGADLVVSGNAPVQRIWNVYGTYDSGIQNDVAFLHQVQFTILPRVGG
jgi:hypothetical protein